jgi:amidase
MSGIRNIARYNDAFITLFSPPTTGIRLAVKDAIDVAGVVTTAGCEWVAEHTAPAREDAACLRGFRTPDVSIVGKTNLHELAFGTTGLNSWSGTAINPLGSDLVPGGSSSGNAVALAIDACDLALGTDTGGSVRIPSACCGTAGLKPTYGTVSMEGVWPLAPSLDTLGPMAKDVAGLLEGMRRLVPGFSEAGKPASQVGRLRVGPVDPNVDAAVDSALLAAGLRIVDCEISEAEWEAAIAATTDILWAEAALSNIKLKPHWSQLQNGDNLEKALVVAENHDRVAAARKAQLAWKERLAEVAERVGLIASPTLEAFPPAIQEANDGRVRLSRFTSPVNLSGLPAIVIPVPSAVALPSSLQFIGPRDSEGYLLATAGMVEKAVAANSVD